MNGVEPVATSFRAMGTDVTVLVLDGPPDAGGPFTSDGMRS